jgi:hypothetical protein
MQKGDISNFHSTAAWDFRLFLDVHYPKLFEFFLKRKMYKLAELCYKFNQGALAAYEQHNLHNNVVLVTHPAIKHIFHKKDMNIVFLPEVQFIDQLNADVIFTPDTSWVLCCKKCVHYAKPVSKIHSKAKNSAVLQYLEKFLDKRV